MFDSIGATLPTEVLRLHEEAADELARLDTTCRLAPASATRALWLSAASALVSAGAEGLRLLAASASDPVSAQLLTKIPRLSQWERFMAEEERRVRGGAPLTRGRLARAGVPLHDVAADRLDLALRGSSPRGSALIRALDVAASIPDPSLGDAAAALILCAEGRTDYVRLLPFAGVPAVERTRVCQQWRDGDAAPWAALAFTALAEAARVRRPAVERLLDAPAREAQLLEPIGRAAITARRALVLLRETFTTTVPLLSEQLAISRPAAGDALRRLAERGLVHEITARRRNRVYAYALALDIALAP